MISENTFPLLGLLGLYLLGRGLACFPYNSRFLLSGIVRCFVMPLFVFSLCMSVQGLGENKKGSFEEFNTAMQKRHLRCTIFCVFSLSFFLSPLPAFFYFILANGVIGLNRSLLPIIIPPSLARKGTEGKSNYLYHPLSSLISCCALFSHFPPQPSPTGEGCLYMFQ
jgi:hypothetical protein